MDLSIIIVSYNTKKVLKDCLQSILSSTDRLKKEIIVVDNNSSDGSITMVKKHFPQVKAIQSGKNLGFAKANNLGANLARAKYLWLLNSDTLLKPNTIQQLFDLVQTNNSQIASCKLLNKDNTIQPQGGYLPRLTKQMAWMFFIDDLPLIGQLIRPYQQRRLKFFEKDQHPGWLSGTALLVKRSLYQKLKGLDKKIFMYGEDVDFCLRAKSLGIIIDYFAKPELIHLGQTSGSSRGAVLGEYQGIKYIYKKHKPAWEYPLLIILLKLGALLRVLIFGIILQDKNKKQIYAEAFKVA